MQVQLYVGAAASLVSAGKQGKPLPDTYRQSPTPFTIHPDLAQYRSLQAFQDWPIPPPKTCGSTCAIIRNLRLSQVGDARNLCQWQ